MSSQAQRNEEKWQKHVDKLAKAGFSPSIQQIRGYEQARQFWNNVDTEAASAFNNLLTQEEK